MLLCQVMQVSRSGYYKYCQRQRAQPALEVGPMLIEIKAIACLSHHSYGSRRMAKHLQAKGYVIGRYAVRTLMRKAGLVCKQRRRYSPVTTHSQHALGIAENVLNREFAVSQPDQVWVTDISVPQQAA